MTGERFFLGVVALSAFVLLVYGIRLRFSIHRLVEEGPSWWAFAAVVSFGAGVLILATIQDAKDAQKFRREHPGYVQPVEAPRDSSGDFPVWMYMSLPSTPPQ